MKVIAEIPEYLLNQVRVLVEKGTYPSIESFVRAGVENQLVIECDSVRTPERLQGGPVDWPREISVPAPGKPAFFAPPVFEDINVGGARQPKDLWMWGQVNRILPIKAALRFIAHVSPDGSGVVSYLDLSERIKPIARELGIALEKEDEARSKQRGEGLAPAFPTGSDHEKAHARFMSLFVGYKRGDGKLVGAAPFLRFVNLRGPKDRLEIGLTSAGFEFAQLANPAFDSQDFTAAFCQKEVEFYLEHILKSVPGETDAFKMILSVITDRRPTREAVHEAIKDRFPGWSDALINTQRAGTMSRLFELGLISKEKIGVNVLYHITERGTAFLKA